MNEATEKIRLKFRVSSMKEPKWTEKWGVGLSAGEEFHITDKLLKLPFRENPPKTVCTFSVDRDGLLFQHLDPDRLATRNGTPEKKCHPRVGDKIIIGETILVEVLIAPALAAVIPEMLDLDRQSRSDGPTLTLTRTLTGVPPIHEPSLEMVRPELSPRPARAHPLPAETKIELAASPHSHRDDSLDEGMSPLYPPKAQLGSKLSFSEKILAAVAKVLRRDELNPPEERFPLDKEATNPEIRRNPEPKASRGEFAASPQVSRSPGKAWIPEPAPAGARLRGRALVFLAAAAGALALGAGALKISDRLGRSVASPGSAERANYSRMDRGIPVEFIEEKVRKMRRRR